MKNKQVRAERTHAADTKVILSDKNTVIKWRKNKQIEKRNSRIENYICNKKRLKTV